MRILFLGGTQFVGRHMVEAALSRGHTVTLFNRGQTHAELFPEVEKLRGDRDGGLQALEGRRWEAVIDVNGYVPRLVRASAELLRGSVDHYIFISTGSVYDFNRFPPGGDESSPLEKLEDETTEEYHGPAYGGLKVLCEKAVQEVYPDQRLVLRLGVVAGPHDPTDRITSWVRRVARGGEMLAPGAPERPIQYIDARDLANFTISAAEKGLAGIFNTTGEVQSWGCFLEACKQASHSDAFFTWVDDDLLFQKSLASEQEFNTSLPMYVSAQEAHVWTMNSDKALAQGLVYRSTLNTARDILAWEKTRPAGEGRRAGLSPELEQKLLLSWRGPELR
ncbi:MAG: NAD-dependent epimerase/dehydratase family protein [Chloroflexi bacterium]|nr:NAD-dependent epimerase/dehydratase family protein [Chloroflexota bacterium]